MRELLLLCTNNAHVQIDVAMESPLSLFVSHVFMLEIEQTVVPNNTITLSRHEQVCLTKLHFDRYFFHHCAYASYLFKILEKKPWQYGKFC